MEYVDSLYSLAIIYDGENKILNAIMLIERALKIIEFNYPKNKENWHFNLIKNLKALISLYRRCNQTEEVRFLEKKMRIYSNK